MTSEYRSKAAGQSACKKCCARGTCLKCQGPDKWHMPTMSTCEDGCDEGLCSACQGFGWLAPHQAQQQFAPQEGQRQ